MESEERPVLLALRALKLGDLLVAVPALKALRRGYPHHRIVLASPGWLAPIVPLIAAHEGRYADDPPMRVVDQLLPTPGLDDPLDWHGPVDVAVNLHGRGPESDGLLDALNPRFRIGHAWPDDGRAGPGWVDGINERVRWARLVTAFGLHADPSDVALEVPLLDSPRPGAVVLHVGAFYGARQWPIERFAAVARALTAEGHEVVVTGGAADGERAEEVAWQAELPRASIYAGRRAVPLDRLAALVASARLLISADTGVAHLASAYATPSIVIFGPAPVAEWGPPPGPHRVLTHEELRRGEVFSAEPDPALLAVTVDEVLAEASDLLSSAPHPHDEGEAGEAGGAAPAAETAEDDVTSAPAGGAPAMA